MRYTSIIFDEGRDGVFTLTYDKAWSGRDLLIELKPREGNTQADLVEWLSACRIASSSQHKELATKRLGANVPKPCKWTVMRRRVSAVPRVMRCL